jgi:hypothetical protein
MEANAERDDLPPTERVQSTQHAHPVEARARQQIRVEDGLGSIHV